MSTIITQSIKEKIIVNDKNPSKFKPIVDTLRTYQYQTQDVLHATNMITGGFLTNLVTSPSWEAKVEKAGLGLLHSLDKDDNEISLLFQYNPQTLKESFSVSYNYRQTYAGEPSITEFKSVEPQRIFIEFYLDAYYDYAGLDDYFKDMVAGASQSALLLLGAGSRGFSETTFGIDRLGRYTDNKNFTNYVKDKRTLKPALENLKKFVRNTYYSLSKAQIEFDGTTTYPNPIVVDGYTGNPPLCILNWGAYNNFKCIVRDMNFEHTMFNPGTLDPIRSKIVMELEEYNNPFLEGAKESFDGQITGWYGDW